MYLDETPLDDEPTYVWRRTIATALMLVAAGFAYFALAAAQAPVDEGTKFSVGMAFSAVSLLLAGSSIASWFGRWWLTAGLVIAAIALFVAGMPDRCKRSLGPAGTQLGRF